MDLCLDTEPLKKPSKRRRFSCTVIKNLLKSFFAGNSLKDVEQKYKMSRKGLLNIFERKTYRDCWSYRDIGFLNAEHYKKTYERIAKENMKKSPGRGHRLK